MKRKLTRGSVWRNADNSAVPVGVDAGSEHVYDWDVRLPETLLGTDERGLVITDWAQNDLRNGVNIPPTGDGDVRSELVFFDKFDVPIQPSLRFRSESFFELEAHGLAQRSIVSGNGNQTALLRGHAFRAYRALDKREVDRWAMGRSVRALGVRPTDLLPRQGVRMAVTEALPVFTSSVEIEEILNFKRRRWAELLALRNTTDRLVENVARNGNHAAHESQAFRDFNESLVDYVKVMSESNFEKVKRSFYASFSWDSLSVPVSELIVTGSVTALSGMGAAATIMFKTIDGLKSKNGVSPFEYLTSANREFG